MRYRKVNKVNQILDMLKNMRDQERTLAQECLDEGHDHEDFEQLDNYRMYKTRVSVWNEVIRKIKRMNFPFDEEEFKAKASIEFTLPYIKNGPMLTEADIKKVHDNIPNFTKTQKKVTSTGHVWTKLDDDSYKDEISGISWLAPEPGTFTHSDALKLQTDKKKLPTIEEYEEAEKHGIREVLDMKDKYWWSASLYPNNTGSAREFSGYSGYSGTYGRGYNNYVRCRSL